MDILRAMSDEKLFAPSFRPHPEHGDTWGAWKAFLAALHALPMGEAALATYRHHTGRTEPPAAPFKEAALICGRRSGKSRVLSLLAVHAATFRNYKPFLAPGEVATVAVIAADRRQARQVFRYVTGLLRSVPLLAGMIEEETAERIGLNNGVEIEVATASFRVTRGYSYACVLADEIAFWRNENTAVPDLEIIQAIRPGLSTIPGAMLLMASSPYAQRGVLWNMFKRHYGRDDARVLVWKAATAELNPTLDPAIIAEAYEDDAAAASAEFGGDFRADVAEFVAREALEACVVPGRYELPPVLVQRDAFSHPALRRAVAFCDPSGGSSDSMTLAIAHGEQDVAVLDCIREVKPPFSPQQVVADFAALLKSYGVARVTGDRYGGEWPREQFRNHGITYDLADKPKSDLYRDLLPALNSGRVELLDVPKLSAQFLGLERRAARGGRDSIDHPPGSHDDVANAVAGALLGVTTNAASGRAGWMAMTLSREAFEEWKAGRGPHAERR